MTKMLKRSVMVLGVVCVAAGARSDALVAGSASGETGDWRLFKPGEVMVGGEIGRHFDLTVGKVLNHCDFENDFLKYFRERTPGEAGVEGDNEKNGGPYNGFVGIGMFLDGVVKACARGIGGAPLRAFKDKAIADLVATQGTDGSISVFTSIPKGRVVWPHRAVWDSHESAYILQALVGDYLGFGNRPSLEAAIRLADHIIEREEGINLGCETAFVMLWQATGDAKYRRWLEDHLVIAAPPEKYDRLLCACSLRHVYASFARAVAQLDYAAAAGSRDPALFAFPQTLAGRLFGPYSSVSGSCTTGDAKREWGEIWGTAQYGTGKWGETCATAYAMRFSKKMLLFDPSTRWGDQIERATYNAFFAAQSEDGVNCRYFVPFEEQGEWWPRDTYCCPNNFRRWIFELADVVFLRTPEGVAVNLYSDATLRTDGLAVEMRTRYPEDGEVLLRVDAAKPLELKLRIPCWSREPDAGTWRTVALKAGRSETRLALKLEDRYVAGRAEQSGKVALMRGPLVYGVDRDGRRVRFSDASRVHTYIPLPAGATAVPDELFSEVEHCRWPLVTMRQMSSTTFDKPTLEAMYAIHARHPGAVDEFWLADCEAKLRDVMTARARQIGGYAEASAKVGIIQGYQQGVTLGHDFSKRDETSWALPDDAWQIDRNGNRTGFPCPRSPAVQEMEETYAETYVREGKIESFWLDDDLRLGFCKRGVESCWCPRCLKALNERAKTSFTREEAVKRLNSSAQEDPLRKIWAETRAETLAEFARAAARGARRANPKVRMAYQAISSATINSGEDNAAILEALSDGWKHPVGIRPGHGYYDEDSDVKREIAAKVLDVAREAERCRRYPNWCGSIVYEQENYPHHVMQKTMDAIVREGAIALAAGCDAVALYWYCSNYPEPLSYYEELVADAALWKPYYRYLSDLAVRTHLGGVSKARDPNLMIGPNAAMPRMEGLVRRDPAEVSLALMGVPVTIHEAGSTNHFASDWVPRGHYLDKVRTELLDRLDRGEPGGVCVRVDKSHPLLVYPRVDAQGRTVAVTFVNVSIGMARALPVRVRRPAGKSAAWVRPLEPKAALAPAAGEGDEWRLTLPDLGPWEIATLDLR